jgi:cobalt-zinc-cadmium efflux system outer membrane protein
MTALLALLAPLAHSCRASSNALKKSHVGSGPERRRSQVPNLALSTVLLVLLTSVPSSSQAQELDSLILKAISTNPSIKAAMAKVEMFDAQKRVKGSLPDPMLSFHYQGTEVGISQMIPLPPKLSLESSIAGEARAQASAEYDAAVLAVTREVKTAYFDLYYINHALEVAASSRKILSGLSGVLASRYASGISSQADLLKLDVEVSKFREREVVLEQLKREADARLAKLLYVQPDSVIVVGSDLPQVTLNLGLEELRGKARSRRPEILAALARTRQGEKALSLAHWQFMPDLELGVSYMIKDNMPNAMVGLSLPLWWGKQNAMVREAQAAKAMYEADYQSMLNETDYMLTDIYSRIEKDSALTSFYQSAIIPEAQGSFDASLAGYQAGKVDFMTVLDNLTTLYMYKDEYYMKRSEYFKDIAALEAIAGERIY